MIREQLEQGRHRYNPHRIYGHFYSYCNQMRSCEECKENDKKIWIIAEQLEKENKNADLSKFIDLYLKLKETDQQNGVSDLD